MPRRCIAAGCDTVSGKGYSFHKFPKDDALRRRWVSAVKRQRSNWDGPSKDSQLCSKHFEEGCFITDGVRFREEMGIPTVKRLTEARRCSHNICQISGLQCTFKPVAALQQVDHYQNEDTRDR